MFRFKLNIEAAIKKAMSDKKQKYTWLLDPGHGGMIDGEYQTAGKRSPEFEFGQYFEGVGNGLSKDQAKIEVSEMLGHGRGSVTDIYLGG